MKKNTDINKLLAGLILLLLAVVFVPGFSGSSTVQAATKVTANSSYKKAPKLKKTGTYLVTAKKNNSYVRFVAPAKGTYSFTISSIKTPGVKAYKDTNLGNLYALTPQNGYLFHQNIKTQGGKAYCLYTATKTSYNKFYKSKKVTKNTYLASRTGTISLQKGQSLYLQYFYTGGNKCSYTLTFKKK